MKFIVTSLFFILFLSGCTNAALLLANNLARFGDYTAHHNIQYGNTSKQRLDIYLPHRIAQLAPSKIATVVFFYGGCWGACSDLTKEDYLFVAEALTANDIVTIIVDYQQFPESLYPAILSDVSRSVEWVYDQIDSYGANRNNIFVMGHSAGAHLASMLTFNENNLRAETYAKLKGFIGLSGPYDFLPFDEPYQPALFAPPESYADSQTINFVDGNEAPALLLYGNDDTRVKRKNIISLSQTIVRKNGRVETHFYDGVDHTGIISSFAIPLRSSQAIINDIVSFISKILSDESSGKVTAIKISG